MVKVSYGEQNSFRKQNAGKSAKNANKSKNYKKVKINAVK